MKPLRLLCSVAILPITIWMAACSSKDTKTTSGGAFYRLVGVASAKPGACLDATASLVTIANKGDDGGNKLIPDGSGGATANCAYNDTDFHVLVQNGSGYAVGADGHFSAGNPMMSTDAKMLIVNGANTYKSPSDGSKPCTITFTKKADGALLGKFVCDELDYTKDATNMCAANTKAADGSAESYFQFADCTN